MTKPLVIYHANCADGFGAAFAAWLKLGDDAEYEPVQYGNVEAPVNLIGMFEDRFKDRDVYILDFSFPREIMDWLFANAKRVVWLDHHKTAFEMWRGEYEKGDQWLDPTYGWDNQHHIHLNDNKSGAYLAWEYFHPGTEVPMLIRHIDDYDRWQFKLLDTKEFNKALWSWAPWSFEQWDSGLGLLTNVGIENCYPEGAAILRAHDQNVQAVVKGSARECVIPPQNSIEDGLVSFTGLAANCPPHLTSDVGHELATQSGTFGLCWTLSREGLIAKCSLRSNGDYDVSAIAKAFGGGGHRNAAGFEVPLNTLIEWMR